MLTSGACFAMLAEHECGRRGNRRAGGAAPAGARGIRALLRHVFLELAAGHRYH